MYGDIFLVKKLRVEMVPHLNFCKSTIIHGDFKRFLLLQKNSFNCIPEMVVKEMHYLIYYKPVFVSFCNHTHIH